MAPFSIRRLRPTDVLAVSRLVQRVVRNEFSAVYPAAVIRAQLDRYSPERIQASSATRWVAVTPRGRVVGTVGVQGAEIVGLFVSKRARNQGVGSALMRAAEKAAFLTHKKAFVFAALGSEGFDEHRGYTPVRKVTLTTNGVPFNVTYLVKKKPRGV